MDYEQLVKDQELVDEYIRYVGVNRGVAPIYDGVVDPSVYAEVKPRIACVLKEPYSDFDEQGNPCGGGWSLSDIYHDTENVYDNIKGNKTIYSMAYATYGILKNTEYAMDISGSCRCKLTKVCRSYEHQQISGAYNHLHGKHLLIL